MKNIHFISLLAVILFMTSCKSLMFSDNLMKVTEGMNQKDVKELLGTATHRRFDQGMEEWEYVQEYTDGRKHIAIIRFSEGRVTGMDSFETPLPKGPHKPGEGNPPHRGKNPRH